MANYPTAFSGPMPYQPYGMVANPQPQYPQPQYQQPQQPQYQPMQQPQPMPMQGISQTSHVVASREEASAVPADFSGMPIIMPVMSNGEVAGVFVKQWNLAKGQTDFKDFLVSGAVYPAPTPDPHQPQQQRDDVAVISMQDYQGMLNNISDLQDAVNAMQKELDGLRKQPSVPARTSRKEKVETDGE